MGEAFTFRRRRQPELMDQPGLDVAAHHRALAGLARINRVSRCAATLWRPLAAIARRADGPIAALDLACGGGDVAVALQRRAESAGLDIRIAGCDKSDVALLRARAAAGRAGLSMRFFEFDALAEPIEPCDVVLCTLFLHHLDRDDIVPLLERMRQAAGHILIDDLERSRRGLVLACLGTRVLSRSALVHVDGPRSVRGAFTVGEMADMASQAGLTGATVTRHWPRRWLLQWSRS